MLNHAVHPRQMAFPNVDIPDDEEFADFLGKVEDVHATIKGLKDGSLGPDWIQEMDAKEAKLKADLAAKEAKKSKQKEEQEAKVAARIAERKRMEEYKEANKDKLQELKENYYLRKARRERWVEFRETNRSRAFSDYYKGWDLFEEDPDEELFGDPDKPAAVQDQGAFDAMAKDCEERTKTRKAQQAACDKERERANLAFKAGQFSEAVAGYTRAVDLFKGEKTCYANRAAAHLKLRNFLSALDDCSRVIEISRFLDDDYERRPPPPPLLKAYVRRAAAQSELGRYTEATEDLATALEMAPEAERAEIKRQQKIVREEAAAAKREAVIYGGESTGEASAAKARAKVRAPLARRAAGASPAASTEAHASPLGPPSSHRPTLFTPPHPLHRCASCSRSWRRRRRRLRRASTSSSPLPTPSAPPAAGTTPPPPPPSRRQRWRRRRTGRRRRGRRVTTLACERRTRRWRTARATGLPRRRSRS